MENTNKQTVTNHLDYLGDVAKQVRDAQRDAARQIREAQRQQREAQKQLREAARKLRDQMRSAPSTSAFGTVPDLSSWAIAARKIMDSQKNYQVFEQPQANQSTTSTATTNSKPTSTGKGFYGTKTKETIEGQKVTVINGVLSVEPDRDELAAHKKFSAAMTPEEKIRFEKAQTRFRQQAKLFLKLVGHAMEVPEEAMRIWVTAPDKKSLARTQFDTVGTAFISIDLDDVQANDDFLLSYFYLHEFFHLIGRYQTYSLSGEKDGLEYQQTVFKLGLETTVTTTYKVSGISRGNWDEWAKKLLEIRKGLKTSTSYSYSASPKVIAMIKLCKAKFGKSWLNDSIDVLKSKGEELYEIGIWKAEVKEVEGTNINETIVDALGRIASCQNPLEPTDEELAHLRSAGTYGNLKGINRLIKLYCTLSQVQKIELLTVMLNALQTGDATSLVSVLSQDGMKVSLEALLQAKLPAVGDEGEDPIASLLGELLSLFAK